MKKKVFTILMCLLGVMAAVAIGLIIYNCVAQDSLKDTVKVSVDGITEETLSVGKLSLNPSESKNYAVNLVCPVSGKFNINMEFIEKEDGGLKEFVEVVISFDGENVLFDGSLSELLDGKQINFDGSLDSDKEKILTVKYTMPADIGNEAQGVYADFDILLTVENVK